MNQLNERLRSIRVQKVELRKLMRDETDRRRLMDLRDNIQKLSVEEEKCLKELKAYE